MGSSTTDTPTTVELALALREEPWFPFPVIDRAHLDPEKLMCIAWTAAVWLLAEGCDVEVHWSHMNQPLRWYGIGEGRDVEDTDPIRATLLAATEASKR